VSLCYPAHMGYPASLKRDATYADLCQVPDHLVAEILEGELFATPRPAIPHAHATSALGGELFGPFHRGRGGPGGWWILDEPELHLGPDVVVPDLGGWKRLRMPTLPSTAAITLAPDWVCEVVSPSTETLDRTRKLRIYARERVEHIWLVNPVTRTLEVFKLGGDLWVLQTTHAGDAVVRADPFEAIELDLLTLWGESRAVAEP